LTAVLFVTRLSINATISVWLFV